MLATPTGWWSLPSQSVLDYDQSWGKPLDHTRKIFEFYVASGVRINGGLPVEVASGADSSQANPDVKINGGFPIKGVACKVVSGQNIQTIIENIEKGSSQVEKSSCTKGIVALDVRHRIDTELLFPQTDQSTFRTFKHANFAEAVVQKLLGEIADEILNATSKE